MKEERKQSGKGKKQGRRERKTLEVG